MNKMSLVFGVLTGLMANTAGAQDVIRDSLPKPTQIIVAPDRVFAPSGFDDNDTAQVVFESSLISTCYKSGPVRTQVDQEKKTIYVEATQYVYAGSWCAQVVTQYNQTLDLGMLTPGTYKVVAMLPNGKTRAMATLPIKEATSQNPDDYLYAPVSEAFLERNQMPAEPVIILRGVFGSNCMYMKEVKINYVPGNVIEILPIAAIHDGMTCQYTPTPFETRVDLDRSERGKRLLLHVRSLNGKSLNVITTF